MQTETLCTGCDSPLGADRFCASCEEVVETYEYPLSASALYDLQFAAAVERCRQSEARSRAWIAG